MCYVKKFFQVLCYVMLCENRNFSCYVMLCVMISIFALEHGIFTVTRKIYGPRLKIYGPQMLKIYGPLTKNIRSFGVTYTVRKNHI